MKTVFTLIILIGNFSTLFCQNFEGTKRYDDYFRKYSKRFFGIGFDWHVFKAQGIAESNLSPESKSWVGAIGIMQLMPGTFKDIQSALPEIQKIDDPQWNIAAGILYDRQLWKSWEPSMQSEEKLKFVFGSYNAGRVTISNAQKKAKEINLDYTIWQNIEIVAPQVQKWRHEETLNYVKRIELYYSSLSKRDGFKEFLGK